MNKIIKEDGSGKIMSSDSQSVKDSFFSSVFNNNQAIMLLVDPGNKQKILEANDSALKFYGYTREEILQLNMGNINTISKEKRQKLMKKAIDLPNSYFQFEHKTSSGMLKNVEVNASPVDYNNKKVMFVIVHDITDLKTAESALKESEERFRGLAEATTEAVFLSENGICLDQNKRAEELFGYSQEEAIGVPAVNWIISKDRDLVSENIKSEYSQKYEVTGLRKNGSIFPAEIKGKILEYKGRRVRVTALRDLTKSKSALAELKKSNEQLELSIAGSNLGLWDWRVQTGDLYINERWAEMLGYSLEEILPVTNNIWRDLCHPDDLEVVDTQFKRYLEKESDIYKADFRMKHKNGSWIWLQTQGKVFEWKDDGQPLRVAGTHLDINEKKSIELKLAASEERHRSYFENSPLSLWEQDYSAVISFLHELPVAGEENLRIYLNSHTEQVEKCSKMLNFLDVNPATIRMYEACSKEELFSNIESIYTPESSEMFVRKLVSLYYNHTSIKDETIHKTLKGRKLNVKLETSLLPNLRALVTITDITEQKSMQKKIEESETKFRSYFESSPLALWEEDYTELKKYLNKLPVYKDGELLNYLNLNPNEISKCLNLVKILNMNQSALDLYEADSKKMLIENFTNIFTPESLEDFKKELISLYNNEKSFECIFTDKTLKGKDIVVNFEMTKLSENKYLTTSTDITDLKKNENRLKELLAQTKDDSETKEILLREINHRVKNNLSSFIGMLYAEKKQSGSDPDAVQMAHVDNLINRIKGISIAHDMLSRSMWAPISVYKLTEKIIHSLNHLIPKDRIIDVKLNSSNIFLDADQSHSTAILINELYSNSIEHASHQGETIEVEIEIKEIKGKIIFIFKDNGPGYPEDILNSQFYNVGMYLIKNIIEQSLRGSFKIFNQGGAKIEIEFPGGSKLEEL